MTKESDSEGLRREIKQKGREEAIEITMRRTLKVWRHKRKYCFLWPKEDYMGEVMGQVRESLFSYRFFFEKQPIENKFYFL